METRADKPPVTNAYNSKDRNAFLLGGTQAELWNGRLAMIGLLTYFGI